MPISTDPPLADDVDPKELDPEARAELRSMSRTLADAIACRLVAAGQLMDVDPEQAYAHSLVARRLASRIPSVREAVGLAAYHAGEWQSAIGELRAYHRMSGRRDHLAILADCERALDRPDRAIDLFREADLDQLDTSERIELLIVAAGARNDLKQSEAAVAMLQIPELHSATVTDWLARLRYAYADSLLIVGRDEEAREWFARAAEVDEEMATDAAERLLELDGVVIDDAETEDDSEDEVGEGEGSASPEGPESEETGEPGQRSDGELTEEETSAGLLAEKPGEPGEAETPRADDERSDLDDPIGDDAENDESDDAAGGRVERSESTE